MNIQIPNFHISDKSKVGGSGNVTLVPDRKDASHSGIFGVKVDVVFDPAVNDYPTGSVRIDVDLTDAFKGFAEATTIEQINTHGKHTPTAYLTGRCRVTLAEPNIGAPRGCRFWLLIANNKQSGEQGTPDVASFVVFDREGKRVAYGTGPLTAPGNIEVSPTVL